MTLSFSLLQRRRILFPSYIVYDGYTSLKSILGGFRKAVVEAGDTTRNVISGQVADVGKKAQDLSSAAHESIKPTLSKASEELPKTIQAVSSKIGKAADGAKDAVISHWKWVKEEVEGRRK